MGYLLEWQYLLFVLPFSAAALLYFIMMLSGLGFEGTDTDHDIGAGHDHDADVHGDSSFVLKALGVLGVGRVPLSIVLTTFCFVWGFVGFCSNKILEPFLISPFVYVWPSIAVAFFSSIVATRVWSGFIARVIPKTESYAAKSTDFVGKKGNVLHTVTENSGRVRIVDDYYNIIDLDARINPGAEEILSGTEVFIISYTQDRCVYLVALNPLIQTAN